MFDYYKHFKGGFYRRVTSARDCDNPEHRVEVYQSLQFTNYPYGEVYYREVSAFHGMRGEHKRMRKLKPFECLLLLAGLRQFIK